MPLVLVKEDGSGRADANAYADVADGDAYHEGHLYASAWTAATEERKTAALVMATRLIDALTQFNGARTSEAQALQWPRQECPDPDDGGQSVTLIWWRGDRCLATDVVPERVLQATCEMARELLLTDRTAAPAGEGISAESSSTRTEDGVGGATSSSSSKSYSKSDTRAILSHVAQALLSKYGSPVGGGGGMARLVRV